MYRAAWLFIGEMRFQSLLRKAALDALEELAAYAPDRLLVAIFQNPNPSEFLHVAYELKLSNYMSSRSWRRTRQSGVTKRFPR